MELLIIILTILIPVVVLLLCSLLFRNKNGIPTNWPLVGMLPAILLNLHRLHDYSVEVFEKSGLTFEIKGPWLTNMHLVVTADPTNIHHITSKCFNTYVKGYKLYEIMDVFGDGILNTDSTIWNYHRNVALSFFNHPKSHSCLVQTTFEKIENGLFPVLDHASKGEIEIDLQEVFLRFMYDTSSNVMMNYDPKSLTIDMPYFPLLEAVTNIEHVILFRHVVPTCMWKFMRWLNVGGERKYKQACRTIDDFIYKQIHRKREEKKQEGSSSMQRDQEETKVRCDLLTLFMDKEENQKLPLLLSHNNTSNNINNNSNHINKFLRDTIANFYLAGGETIASALSWFFYLVSKNPQVILNIKEELKVNMIQTNNNNNNNDNNDNNIELFQRNFEELSGKLIYLHAALCESLRLYPSIPFNPRGVVIEPVMLPSGHRVTRNTQLIIDSYIMGRMKEIWGDDCNEFKPERWIDDEKWGRRIKHEPSYKFSVFSSGPRTCLGKQMAFTQMKILAATIIQNYHIEVIEQYHVPDVSMVCRVKNGFKVKMHRYLQEQV